MSTHEVGAEHEEAEESANPQEDLRVTKKRKSTGHGGPPTFPSMLFEERPTIEVNAKLRKRFLIFRVYEDPI